MKHHCRFCGAHFLFDVLVPFDCHGLWLWQISNVCFFVHFNYFFHSSLHFDPHLGCDQLMLFFYSYCSLNVLFALPEPLLNSLISSCRPCIWHNACLNFSIDHNLWINGFKDVFLSYIQTESSKIQWIGYLMRYHFVFLFVCQSDGLSHSMAKRMRTTAIPITPEIMPFN